MSGLTLFAGHNAMINAEEMGITSDNINAMTYNKITPAEARFIGKEGKFGAELGQPMTGLSNYQTSR